MMPLNVALLAIGFLWLPSIFVGSYPQELGLADPSLAGHLGYTKTKPLADMPPWFRIAYGFGTHLWLRLGMFLFLLASPLLCSVTGRWRRSTWAAIYSSLCMGLVAIVTTIMGICAAVF
jgi:hypothetical protein